MRSSRREPSGPSQPTPTGLVSIPLARILADPVVTTTGSGVDEFVDRLG